VERLAAFALSNCNFSRWVAQDVANTLLACTVLQSHARASEWAEHAPVLQLSKALFHLASKGSAASYKRRGCNQISRAHFKAQELGRPGLACDSRMLAAVTKARQEGVQRLVKQPLPQLVLQAKRAAAALGRYRIVEPYISDDAQLVQGAIEHMQQGYRICVLALTAERYMRYPIGRLLGVTQLLLADLARHCAAVVLVYEHEWEALGSTEAQNAHIDQLLLQAEAAIAAAAAAAAEPSQQQSSLPPTPAPSTRSSIVVGLLPQDHPVTIPAPPPSPVLSPEEVQAKMQELKLKQQAAAQKLAGPSLPSRQPSTGAAPPSRPQPPPLRAPCRPGA
jgi:hypothetical protein